MCRLLSSVLLLGLACPFLGPIAAQPAPFPVRAVTQGPKHHFVGYYDITPFDKTGRYLAVNEIDFVGRQPKEGEALSVGIVDLQSGKFKALDKTLAWCWQMGTRLQWLPTAPEREVIYNAVEKDRYVAIVRDVFTGKTRTLPCPIYALSADGAQAVTLDFDRLHRLRPGYGYLALPEKHADDPAPKSMGIYWMDLKTGANKLIVPIHWAAHNQPDERFDPKAHHWFNHLLFNPSGTRFIFLHRWQKAGGSWWTRMYTAKPDGSDRKLVFDDGMVSHFDWRDDDHILAWARTKDQGDRFYLINIRTGERRVVGNAVLTRDGHCSYSPDRKWILNDTYPDAKRLQWLMLFNPLTEKRVELGQFFLPKELSGPWRCDLHPRWNRDGTLVCIDSAHEGTRQVYVVDVAAITRK